ncbi:MAG: hypothetical protein LBK56_07200 [Gracilibacteraceae bacterium]|jgi:hypothetical protein|nr:hypothetical protein [Gracilibacteraceae bacterium]
MNNEWVKDYCLDEDESVHKAFYYLNKFRNHKIIIVTDTGGKAVGILTPGDFNEEHVGDIGGMSRYGVYAPEPLSHRCYDGVTVGEVCNRSFKFIRENEDKYSAGRNIFADAGIKILDIPVLDTNGAPVDIFARWQAFYREYLATRRLSRMSYVEPIYQAALLARKKGYDTISVIEFGVAGGTGLVLADLYARETERLTGVRIQVYGFDLGSGLPATDKAEDLLIAYKQGDYVMDESALRRQLRGAKLVLGDIRETAKDFFAKYAPAPIGAMFIDVDLYESTAAVLDMLLEPDDWYLPIVYMWFDDLAVGSDFSGEWLAIKEFNAKSLNSKITPEDMFSGRSDDCGFLMAGDLSVGATQQKRNVRYSHPKWATAKAGNSICELRI